MTTLEITVQRRSGDGWPVVALLHSPLELPVRREGFLVLEEGRLGKQLSTETYGRLLGQALFRDDIRDAFMRAQARNDDLLRLLLFVEDPSARRLRWERLCAPLDGGWRLLRLAQRVPFSLYLPSLTDRRFPPIGRADLRVLLLAASPGGLDEYGLHKFDVEASISSTRAACGEIPCDVLADLDDALGPPTLDALCEQITAGSYTILHVVCHGGYDPSGEESHVFLAGPDGNVDPIPATRLLQRLESLRGGKGLPQLAYLSTCDSAKPEAEGALGGLAQRLVRDLGMPAVVAMTDRITIQSATDLASAFYRRVRVHGQVDLALTEAMVGLAERGDVTVPVLVSRLRDRPLFSDTLERPLTPSELRQGLTRLQAILVKRAPTLLPELHRLAGVLGATQTHAVESSSLSAEAARDREDAVVDLESLSLECTDLGFKAIALGEQPPTYDPRCPFRGLYPFHVEDREFFFGRETLIGKLKQKLAEAMFLPVLGPSGCGKSSLVLAGLVPALQVPAGAVAYLSPGADPDLQLEATLTELGNQPALVVVDQFEELFTHCSDEGKRRTFLARIVELIPSVPIVLTMRADFWGECAAYEEFKALMQAHQELVPAMDDQELRRAMEQQAAAVGLRFEGDVAANILDDVRGEPGAMPLLQHALLELWERRHGAWLGAEEYRALGGVQRAISQSADMVYNNLASDEQDKVRDIFVRLTRLDEDSVQAQDRRDTRRRVGLTDLVPVGTDPATTKVLVTRLASARLLVTSTNVATGEEEVEVAHEALIRYWPLLNRWLDEDRTALRIREGLRRAALEWLSSDRDDNYLVHRGKRLDDAQQLASHARLRLNRLEQTYLQACEDADDRYRPWEVEAELLPQRAGWSDPRRGTFDTLEIVLRHRRTEKYAAAVESGHPVVPFDVDHRALEAVAADPAAYGRILSSSFFASVEMRNGVVEAIEEAQRFHRTCRLQVRIDPVAPELHGLYWETLQHPNDGAPLLTDHGVAFGRLAAHSNSKLRAKSDLRAQSIWRGGLRSAGTGPGFLTMPDIVADVHLSPEDLSPHDMIAQLDKGYDVALLTCRIHMAADGIRLGVSHWDVPARELHALGLLLRPPRLLVLDVQPGAEHSIPITDSSEIALLVQQLAGVGLPAVVVIPASVSEHTRERLLSTLLRRLRLDGQVDKAMATARDAIRNSLDWWAPMLITGFPSCRLWYVPGIKQVPPEPEGENYVWKELIQRIRIQDCTPVLGPAAVPSLPSRTAIAKQWVNRFALPVGPGRVDLPNVAQQLAQSQGDSVMRRLLTERVREEVRRRLQRHDSSADMPDAGLPPDQLLRLAWHKLVGQDSTDPNRLLAALPFPIFVTINSDNSLAETLVETGKLPHVLVLPWRAYRDPPRTRRLQLHTHPGGAARPSSFR